MAVVCLNSWAIYAAKAIAVQVEVNISNGLPCFTLVGLAETAVKESRERVRAAIQNSGLEFPTNKRITVNLAPADLPKESGRFDLPIALAIIVANQQLNPQNLAKFSFSGELSLTGQIKPINGAILMALAQFKANQNNHNKQALILPKTSAKEAALIESVTIYQAENLVEVIQFLQSDSQNQTQDLTSLTKPSVVNRNPAPTSKFDFAQVKGQTSAKRALEIAAVGAHSLLMVGSPGSGKTMLAQSFASILPPITDSEALESAAILSLVGKFDLANWKQRPFWAPHHSASAVALIGGGSPPRPGEISLAHNGVLFLDELPEFSRHALEALREPLENGSIRIARATQQVEFPAKFQLVAAMNPCPCGYLGSKQKTCRCTPDQVMRYQRKLSGPLLDRIDLLIEVNALPSNQLLQPTSSNEDTSAKIRNRVINARKFSLQRQPQLNAHLQGFQLEQYANLCSQAKLLLEQAAERMAWSARSMHRVIRVARSIADLAEQQQIQSQHIAEAIQYKRALLHNILN